MSVRGPFIVLKVEDALFPQYDLPARLQTFLDEQRDWLRDEARKKLAGDLSSVALSVAEHWQKLALSGDRA